MTSRYFSYAISSIREIIHSLAECLEMARKDHWTPPLIERIYSEQGISHIPLSLS